ncbi:MAG: DUF2235 domain-containing protein [Ahrensia sp.]|nr:DUF2235 domain-containing protein [Ahrensia sp.]
MARQGKPSSQSSPSASASQSQKRNIVLFSDGTGNSAAKLNKTNVWRLFEALDKRGNEQDGQRPQLAIYDNGVGTSSFRPLMLLGGAFGFGLKRNVLELYEFLCTHYDDDAEIFLFGYSRGAFTMRMLAALIGHAGILKVGHSSDSDHRVVPPGLLRTYANDAYRRLRYEEFKSNSPFVALFRALNLARVGVWFGFRGFAPLDQIRKYRIFRSPEETSKRPADHCDIRFMGLFDTVSAYGGPVRELTKAWSILFWPMEPRDWNIGTYVRKVCHAVALDEPRDTFSPLLISEKADGGDKSTTLTVDKDVAADAQRIDQTWFPGAHGNVGGGYYNDGLSRIPLNWMVQRARRAGLRFSYHPAYTYRMSTDCCAPLHNPRKGLGGFYRYKPRSMRDLTNFQDKVKIPYPKVHESVIERMRRVPTYAPVGLDRHVEVANDLAEHRPDFTVDSTASSAASTKIVPNLSLSLQQLPKLEADPAIGKPTLSVPANQIGKQGVLAQQAGTQKASAVSLPSPPNDKRPAHVEAAWDAIWWKRVTYFVTFAMGLLIVALPVFGNQMTTLFESQFSGRLAEAAGIVSNEHDQKGCNFVTCSAVWALESASNFLPAVAGRLIDAFIAHIEVFTALLIVWLVLIAFGRYQTKLINLRLAPYWRWIVGKEAEPGPVGASTIQGFRTSPLYLRSFEHWRERIFPGIFIILLVVGTAAVGSVATGYVRDYSFTSWAYCSPNKEESGQSMPRYSLINLCNPVNGTIQEGVEYRIELTIDAYPNGEKGKYWQRTGYGDPVWLDETIKVTPKRQHEPTWWQSNVLPYVSIPFLRHPTSRLFAPTVQIGTSSPAYVKLDDPNRWGQAPGADGKHTVWTYKFTAPRSADVAYFYVNDAFLGFLPESWQFFYHNNGCSTGYVTIRAANQERANFPPQKADISCDKQ